MIFSPSVVQRTNRRLFYRAKVLKLAVCHASVQSGFSTSLRHGDFVTRLSRFTNRWVSTMKMRNENIRCNVMSQMNIFIFYILYRSLHRSLKCHIGHFCFMNSGFLICVRQCCWSATSGTSGFRVVPMDGKADEKTPKHRKPRIH